MHGFCVAQSLECTFTEVNEESVTLVLYLCLGLFSRNSCWLDRDSASCY